MRDASWVVDWVGMMVVWMADGTVVAWVDVMAAWWACWWAACSAAMKDES